MDGADLSRRALEIFEAALALPEEARAAWVAARTDNQPALRAYVERLIAADDRAAEAMATAGMEALATGAGPPPERVGRYRIVSRLGGGGMGDTYLGARDDGLFDHEVAIKLMRSGRMPEASRALFDRERRALAKLSHSHIAQLFDGGVAENDAPFLIMELVRGVSIDDYVRTQSLGAREIVQLVGDICDAVQYAHQNLIVHADLKPANVLVSEVGEVKVVDFGVARLLSEAEHPDAVHPYTPGFASPERLAGVSPTPTDDVFALGALLRELLGPVVQGDLADIIARAGAVDAADRHPSAAALREDLLAWLQTRPIASRRGDRLYILRRFVQRRRYAVAAGVVALLGLIAALVVTTTLYIEAEARFADVRGLSRYLLFDVYERLERTPRSLAMRRDVAREAQTYLEELSRRPGAPIDVRIETVEGLLRVAELQGGRQQSNLGEFDEARANLARAEALAASLPQREAVTHVRTRIALARAALAMFVDHDLEAASNFVAAARDGVMRHPDLQLALKVEDATLANWRGDYAVAIRIADEALAMPEVAAQSRASVLLSLRARDARAEALYYSEDLAGAEAEYERARRAAAAFADIDREDLEARRIAIRARWALATTMLARGDARSALAELDQAASEIPPLLAFEPADESAQRLDRIVLTARAQALAMSGNLEEGVRLLRQQIEQRRALRLREPNVTDHAHAYAISVAMLADLYADNDRDREACPLYAEVRGVFEGLAANDRLAAQDRGSALRMVLERQAAHCAS